MGFTNYLERALLDHVFGGDTYAQPYDIEVGLSLSPIDEDENGITEPSGGYARAIIGNDSDTWEAAITEDGSGLKVNRSLIEFPEAEENWGVVTHFFIASGGNILGFGALSVSKDIKQGDITIFKPGELQIILS